MSRRSERLLAMAQASHDAASSEFDKEIKKINRQLRSSNLSVQRNDNPYDKRKEKITSFKDFDYKGYNAKTMKKADGFFTKAWKGLRKIASSDELRWIAGLIISGLIIAGVNGRENRDLLSALKDIQSGRVDFETLEMGKDALSGILKSIKK